MPGGPSRSIPCSAASRPRRSSEEREPGVPHRTRALAINRRLARRILEAQEAWLDEVEAEFGAP
jgi:hypothetical protein